jgi:nitrate reductase gamma subunit
VLHRPEPAAAPPHLRPAHPLTSHRTDIAILLILWVQLVVGLITLPFSLQHADGSVMLICWPTGRSASSRFRPTPRLVAVPALAFKVHIVLGMTIFLLFPFSRLVHVWSGLPRWPTCSGPTRWCAAAA